VAFIMSISFRIYKLNNYSRKKTKGSLRVIIIVNIDPFLVVVLIITLKTPEQIKLPYPYIVSFLHRMSHCVHIDIRFEYVLASVVVLYKPLEINVGPIYSYILKLNCTSIIVTGYPTVAMITMTIHVRYSVHVIPGPKNNVLH